MHTCRTSADPGGEFPMMPFLSSWSGCYVITSFHSVTDCSFIYVQPLPRFFRFCSTSRRSYSVLYINIYVRRRKYVVYFWLLELMMFGLYSVCEQFKSFHSFDRNGTFWEMTAGTLFLLILTRYCTDRSVERSSNCSPNSLSMFELLNSVTLQRKLILAAKMFEG